MDRDAEGFLLYIVPIVLRINVIIVNCDTTLDPKSYSEVNRPFIYEECKAKLEDIGLYMKDNLNFHD